MYLVFYQLKMIKQKLKLTLKNLPFHTQQNFRIGLKEKHKSSEQFIPKNIQHKKILKSKDNTMVNTLINFHKDYNKKKKNINNIIKETNNFSKGYFRIKQLRDKKQKQQLIFKDLLNRYNNKGYNIKDLFVEDNLFDESLLIHKNYENILKVNEGKEEYQNSIKYLNKLDYMIKNNEKKKKKDIFKATTSLKKEPLKEKEYENLYPPDYDFKKNILLLKYDIYKTKKTLDEINLTTRPDYNSTYQNIISSSSYFNQRKFNSNFSSNSTRNNMKHDFSDNIKLKNDSVSTDNISDNRSNEIQKTIFVRNDRKNMALKMKELLHNEMVQDLNKVYQNIRTKKFDEYKDDIYDYLNKYNKKIPHKIK